MKEKQSFSRKILYNDNLIKILSLVVAILFWFIVVINVSPDYKRTIRGVSVDINEGTSTLTSLGLHVVEKSSKTVNVEVSGPRNLIGRLGSGDFTISPDISAVSKVGKYNIPLSAALKSPDARIQIVKVNPSSVNVQFDTIATKTLSVEVKLTDSNVPSGYLMQTIEKDPEEIIVSGPTTELSAVSKAVAYVRIGSKTETTSVESKIVLLDSDGKSLDLSHMRMSASSVNVTVPILKTRDLPLKVNFTNVPSGFDKNNIDCSINPKTISVAGDGSKIDLLTELSIGDIDFSQIGLATNRNMSISMPDGFLNVGSVKTANVTVTLRNISTREVTAGTFRVINAPSGCTVTNKTNQITNIKLYGPSNDINNVSSVVAVIDMSGVQSGTGQFEVPLSFQVPGKTGYWVTGNYNAVVLVSKQ